MLLTQCDRLVRRKPFPIAQSETALFHEQSPRELMNQRDRKEGVFRAIGTLSQPEQVVVLLFYMSRHSQEDIATFMDIPVTMVNSRLHTARKRLKKELVTMANQSSRPSEDHAFTDEVRTRLGALEKLHATLASSMASLISNGLDTEARVGVESSTQETYVDFLESMPNPSCTLTFKLAPLEGRVTFNLPMTLSWAVLEQLGHTESAPKVGRGAESGVGGDRAALSFLRRGNPGPGNDLGRASGNEDGRCRG